MVNDTTMVPGPPRLPGNPRYIINGREYPVVSADDTDMFVFADIYDQTGITPEKLEELLHDIEDAGKEWARFPDERGWLCSRDHVSALVVQVWLARRSAGEHDLTIREAGMAPISQMAIVVDPTPGHADEEDSEEDPTGGGAAPSGSEPPADTQE